MSSSIIIQMKITNHTRT